MDPELTHYRRQAVPWLEKNSQKIWGIEHSLKTATKIPVFFQCPISLKMLGIFLFLSDSETPVLGAINFPILTWYFLCTQRSQCKV